MAALLTLVACVPAADNPYEYQARVRVVDERGEPIANARVEADGRFVYTDRAGEAELRHLLGPVQMLVLEPAHLTEPLAVDRSDFEAAEDGVVEVSLFAREGAAGSRRWSMHLGGDAMVGRRYVEPPEGLPVLPAHDIDGAARTVVDDLAPVFGAADLGILNLETVVGELPDTAIYPAKRFILLTPAEALSAFDELSIDLVTLANNHTRDYLELGIVSTLEALDAAKLPHVGASTGPEPASNPYVLEPTEGVKVAVFSFTTVDGDFVNDNYALDGDAIQPECLTANELQECFMYDEREWGCAGPSVAIPVASRRAGSAWELFSAAEPSMTRDDQIACWTSLEAVYPEMQDWTARRGHGGAAPWDDENSLAAITAAKADADVVMIQLHAGFQFQTAASSGVKLIARNAIDAGADIVVAHHPHVLQGVEWYAGKLIVHSLGNLVFDQDFMATFTTGFLRTVWDGATLIEARLMPVEIVGYRPIPVTGEAATRTNKMFWEISSTPAYTDRETFGDEHVRRYYSDEPEPDTVTAHIRERHNSALITTEPPPVVDVEVELAAGEDIAAIDFAGVIHAQAGGADVLLGRDLFGWGHLEDVLADDEVQNAAQWFMPEGGRYDPVLRLDSNAPHGFGWVEMYRDSSMTGDTFVRPLGRLNVPEHRLYSPLPSLTVPADGEASYSMRMLGRLTGGGQPYIRLELFEFIDTDPTEDPTTFPIGEAVDIPFTLPSDGDWHTVDVDIDTDLFSYQTKRANVVLVRIRFAPPAAGESVFAIDDFEFIEWRAAAQMQDHFGDYTHLRDLAGGPASFTLEGMALTDD